MLKDCKNQHLYNQLKEEFMQNKTDTNFVQRLRMLAEDNSSW
jgi:hypothetical protein